MQHFTVLSFIILRTAILLLQLNCNKKYLAVYGEGAVTAQTCQKLFAKCPGTIDIWAK